MRSVRDDVDIVMVHNPALLTDALEELDADPPAQPLTILVGHTHKARADPPARRDRDQCGHGRRRGDGEPAGAREDRDRAAVLRGEAEFEPLAVDMVTIDPRSGSATARRERLDEAAPEPTPEPDLPSPLRGKRLRPVDDTVFIGGPEKRAIVIEEYDPAWAARFEQVKASLAEALGPKALQIEHFGSTSVPGLGAKGIIDVLVEVEDVDDEAAYGPALESHGFAIRVRQPGHRMYRTPDQDVHVHVFTDRQRGGADPPPVPRLAAPRRRRSPPLRGHEADAGAPGVGGDERLLRRQGRRGGRDPPARAALGRVPGLTAGAFPPPAIG